MNKLLIIFLLVIVGLTSCTKEPEPQPQPETLGGLWKINSKKKQDCFNAEDDRSSIGIICPNKTCVSAFLCSRENYTFFDDGTLEKFTCGAFLGWEHKCTYTGTHTLIDEQLTICLVNMRRIIQINDGIRTICVEDEEALESECEVYNCTFTHEQMFLEQDVEDGCVESSEYIR